MKKILCFLLLIPLGLSVSGCGTSARPSATPLPESLKGYELYSWQEGNQWVFSLLLGTNREKSLDEIKSSDTALPDVEALVAMLKNVPSGQFITWSSRDTLSFPPDSILQQVEQICQDRGLILNIAK